MLYLLSLMSVLMIVSCSSLQEQARDAYIAGNYEEAIELYQNTLKVDANNTQVKQGLKEARRGWLGKKLIEVRLLRLSKNFKDSSDLLRDVLYKQGAWRVFPTGVAYSTQKEEIENYSRRKFKLIESALVADNPLFALNVYRQSYFVFDKNEKDASAWKVRIYRSAKRFCAKEFKSLLKVEYYTDQWLRKTCKLWELDLAHQKRFNSVRMSSGLELTSTLENVSNDIVREMENLANNALESSHWFHKGAKKKLNIVWSGDFTSSHEKSRRIRSYEYPIYIPYHYTYVRSKSEPPTSVVGTVFSLLDTVNSNEIVKDNGDGTETVTEIKHRKEYRTRNYEVTEHHIVKKLDSKLFLQLGNTELEVPFYEVYRKQVDEHNQSVPEIGLRPTKISVITNENWLKAVGSLWSDKLLGKLEEHWEKEFCHYDEKSSLSEREQIFRCAYHLGDAAPIFVNNYFLSRWNMEYSDWHSLVEESFIDFNM